MQRCTVHVICQLYHVYCHMLRHIFSVFLLFVDFLGIFVICIHFLIGSYKVLFIAPAKYFDYQFVSILSIKIKFIYVMFAYIVSASYILLLTCTLFKYFTSAIYSSTCQILSNRRKLATILQNRVGGDYTVFYISKYWRWYNIQVKNELRLNGKKSSARFLCILNYFFINKFIHIFSICPNCKCRSCLSLKAGVIAL